MMRRCLVCRVEHDHSIGQQVGPFWMISVLGKDGSSRVVCRHCVDAGRDARLSRERVAHQAKLAQEADHGPIASE